MRKKSTMKTIFTRMWMAKKKPKRVKAILMKTKNTISTILKTPVVLVL
jgi:hypothetical protein